VGEVDFWKIRMKPGKPLAFGLGPNGVPIFGLPGNPVSAFVCFQLFVRPALAKLQGAEISERSVTLETVEPLNSTPKREHYISGRIVAEEGVSKFMPVGSTSSGDITAFGAIEALACVPEGVSSVEKGSEVKVLII
jgi:molybdopterin molybdotransferase